MTQSYNIFPRHSATFFLSARELPQLVSELKQDVANCKFNDADRLASTKEMLESLDLDFPRDKYEVIGHRLNGRGTGALVMEKGIPAKVLLMVTHPDWTGVGSELIEQAVNLAKIRQECQKLLLKS